MSTTSETATSPKHYYRDMRSRAEELADENVKARVLKGLELLKEKHGENWADHIDPATLDMGDANQCVLGQVFSEYNIGIFNLGIEDGEEYGFDVDNFRSYSALTKAWLYVFDAE